jgi:prepilin-type N-terminal cleavage/methylation domain-containing protein
MSATLCRRRGFTLVEILIVVVILGILASIVMASMTKSDDDASRNVFVRNLGHYSQGLALYQEQHGAVPTDTSTGVCPPALEALFDRRSFESPTPIGGSWDVEVDENGVELAVGVHFDGGFRRDEAYMNLVDKICDDGDVTTGKFRRIATDRFYWVLR